MNSRQEYKDVRKQCLGYFRNSSVWKKVMEGFRDKYHSYGKFSGKVILRDIDPEDIEVLEGFFGRNFHGQKSVTVSAERFRRALETSRYGAISPEELMKLYFGETPVGRKEQEILREKEKQKLLDRFKDHFAGTPAADHMETVVNTVKYSSRQELGSWEKELRLAADIFNALPYRHGRKMYLAVFAAVLTSNPHAFDHGTPEGSLLYQVVLADLELRGTVIESSDIFASYRRQRSYLAAGIILDDISNYAMLYNIYGICRDGRVHEGTAGFAKEKDILQVPLAVVADWEEIRCSGGEIYIVENPSVFAMLCEQEKALKDSSGRAFMCMNGQPRLSGLMVLDLLAKSYTRVYYSGDLDPEGLMIAQKLAKYYKGEFHFRHMNAEDYEECRSEEKISDKRLKMLEKITDERLKPAAEQIRKHGTAGYQENIADLVVRGER